MCQSSFAISYFFLAVKKNSVNIYVLHLNKYLVEFPCNKTVVEEMSTRTDSTNEKTQCLPLKVQNMQMVQE